MRPNTRVKPLATMKYSDAKVRPLRNVMTKRRALSCSPQAESATIGTPITSAQNHRQNRVMPRTCASCDEPAPGRADLGRLRELAVLHDREQLGSILQDRDVRERVAVDEQQVGEPAIADLAEILAHHDLPAPARRRDERLHRRHAEVLDEVLEVFRVLAVWRPGESVVAAGEHADAALEHRPHALHGRLELELVAHVLRDRVRDADDLTLVE